jgi:urease accessory protein
MSITTTDPLFSTQTASDAARFLLLQLNDATFPIGSYSLSWGLETFVQQGVIHDAATARAYIESELTGSFVYSELLPARFAWEAAETNNDDSHRESSLTLAQIDELYGASRTPKELREGSRRLANRFAKTTAAWNANTTYAVDPNQGVPLHAQNTCAYTPEFYPVAYGSFCRTHEIPLTDTLAVFLYSQTSARVTTSVKLVPLSQTDGQVILNSLLPAFPLLIDKTLSLTKDDICRSCPGTDIRAMQHEVLYTRLYMS